MVQNCWPNSNIFKKMIDISSLGLVWISTLSSLDKVLVSVVATLLTGASAANEHVLHFMNRNLLGACLHVFAF